MSSLEIPARAPLTPTRPLISSSPPRQQLLFSLGLGKTLLAGRPAQNSYFFLKKPPPRQHFLRRVRKITSVNLSAVFLSLSSLHTSPNTSRRRTAVAVLLINQGPAWGHQPGSAPAANAGANKLPGELINNRGERGVKTRTFLQLLPKFCSSAGPRVLKQN